MPANEIKRNGTEQNALILMNANNTTVTGHRPNNSAYDPLPPCRKRGPRRALPCPARPRQRQRVLIVAAPWGAEIGGDKEEMWKGVYKCRFPNGRLPHPNAPVLTQPVTSATDVRQIFDTYSTGTKTPQSAEKRFIPPPPPLAPRPPPVPALRCATGATECSAAAPSAFAPGAQ